MFDTLEQLKATLKDSRRFVQSISYEPGVEGRDKFSVVFGWNRASEFREHDIQWTEGAIKRLQEKLVALKAEQ